MIILNNSITDNSVHVINCMYLFSNIPIGDISMFVNSFLYSPSLGSAYMRVSLYARIYSTVICLGSGEVKFIKKG